MIRRDQPVRPAIALASILIALPLLSAARSVPLGRVPTSSDSSDVVTVVGTFHQALAAGDSVRALAVLAQDVLIIESGGIETRAEYRAHHLPADIQFARAVPSTHTVMRVTVKGDAAWVVSSSVTQGQTNGRSVNAAGAELVVLHRSESGWQITTVHWSSRPRRTS